MTQDDKTGSILRSLQRLYSRLVLFNLQKRMSSYRGSVGSGTGEDITATLYACIDNCASSASAHKQAGTQHEPSRHNVKAAATPSPPSIPANHQESVFKMAMNGLSLYFRKRKVNSVMATELGEKLKKSIWEHIHAAHRAAHQGKVDTARLHADIASTALKEAAHYMPEEEYATLVAEIKDVFNDEKQQHGTLA